MICSKQKNLSSKHKKLLLKMLGSLCKYLLISNFPLSCYHKPHNWSFLFRYIYFSYFTFIEDSTHFQNLYPGVALGEKLSEADKGHCLECKKKAFAIRVHCSTRAPCCFLPSFLGRTSTLEFLPKLISLS